MAALKSEARLQAECFEWFHNSFPHLRKLLYHVPNGELRDPITAGKLKAMGVVAGIPDIVFHFRKRTYFFEFKKTGKGRLSESQKKVIQQLDGQGFIVWQIDNKEDFVRLVQSIIEDTFEQFTLGLPKSEYEYRHRIFMYLYGIPKDKVIVIDDLCESDNKQRFMRHVSDFIVEAYDKLEGFEIMFTNDYKGIYKKDYERE